MNRILLIVIAAFVLTGCEPKEVAKTRNERMLPEGCKIIDLDYGSLTAVVICDGRKTTTSVQVLSSGKHSRSAIVSVIGEE